MYSREMQVLALGSGQVLVLRRPQGDAGHGLGGRGMVETICLFSCSYIFVC